MKIKQLTCALLLAFSLSANAANTITKVPQVSSEVTLTDNVDYVITNATPFAGEGKVNIVNTDHITYKTRCIQVVACKHQSFFAERFNCFQGFNTVFSQRVRYSNDTDYFILSAEYERGLSCIGIFFQYALHR